MPPVLSQPVPAAGEERAREWLAGRVEPVAARDAATVLLVRDGSAGLEVYLQRRAAGLAFAGGMHAFPGGVVDPGDGAVPWADRPAAADRERLGGDAEALVCAAARECLEECAVLPAVGPDGRPPAPVPAAEREAVLRRELRFADLLLGRGLRLSAELLRPWSRWVTPEDQARRYDARFLLAALPPGQQPEETGGESAGGRWERPGECLDAHRGGGRAMLLPTSVTLAELAPLPDVAAALTAAAERPAAPVRPRVVERDGRLVVEAEPSGAGQDP